jgi:hypothetical protein
VQIKYIDSDGQPVIVEAGKVFTGMLDRQGREIYTGDIITLRAALLQDLLLEVTLHEGEFGVWWPVEIEEHKTWASLRTISSLKIEVKK